MGKDLKGKEIGTGITQRANGVYVGRFTDRFGKRPEFKSRKLREVTAMLEQAKYEDSQKLNICESNMTLDEWYIKWLTIHKYDTIRESSKASYKSFYKKHIAPVLGRNVLSEITTLQIKSLINNMDRKGYGFEMKNRARILLIDLFNKAMTDDFVRKNPAKGIKVERDEEIEPKALSVQEQVEFMNCANGTFYYNLFTTALNTGLRPGELCALTVEDIDFKKKEINVDKTLSYCTWDGEKHKTFHVGPPKTKSSKRILPMNRDAELALMRQFMQRNVIMRKSCAKPVAGFENLLFVTRLGTPINVQIYSDAIRSIINEINYCKDELDAFEIFSPHCFRHTFATRCIEAGVKPKTLQSYLGHASLKMTMDLYAHVLPDEKQGEMLKLTEKLDNIQSAAETLVEQNFLSFAKEQKKVVNFRN